MSERLLVYIASPLSNPTERAFNVTLRDLVQSVGYDTYLPQEDGGLLSDLVRQGLDEEQVRQHLFRLDCDAVERADVLLAVLDGRVIDEGVCVELGIAHALSKTCIGLKTDTRSSIRGRDNLMVEGPLIAIARSLNELREYLKTMRNDP